MMDPIKEAFARAKQDIDSLRQQLDLLTHELQEIKRTLSQSQTPTQLLQYPTHLSQIPTDTPTHSNTPTDNLPLYGLKSPYSDTSTGNRGVPTDRQTNQQTNQHIFSSPEIDFKAHPTSLPSHTADRIAEVSHALESLDSFKQDLRVQFKRLTSQEMLVFATIYQLEEEGNTVDYPLVAAKLHLSESSIRDYTLKIIKKRIPLHKTKSGNKKVSLSVPEELKKMASLQTLLTLREL